MKPEESFAVVVRTIGLIICLGSGWAVSFGTLSLLLGGPPATTTLAFMGLLPFLIGLWLLRGARSVVAFAFPKNEPTANSVPHETRVGRVG